MTARIAAIDIGTVSTRLVVARRAAAAGQPPQVVERQARITDLGEGVDATGRLSAQAVGRTASCVADYVARIRKLAEQDGAGTPTTVLTTTTSAARDAANADELLEALRGLGLAPQVIPGEVEATLALLGVTADFGARAIAVADIGGGSTELTFGRRDEAGALVRGRAVSLDVGCRRVTERFFPANGSPAPADALRAARAFVAEELGPFFSQPNGASAADIPETLVCVGGTATSLVAVGAGLVPYDGAFVHLRATPRADVSALTARLCALSAAERAQLPGLQPKRAGVIAAGALILDELMGLGGWDAYTASESDSLMGLLACVEAVIDGAPSPVTGWLPEVALLG